MKMHREKNGVRIIFPKPSARKIILTPFFGVIISAAFIFSCSFNAYADDRQWSGALDGLNWNKAGNWFPSGIPALTDNATVNAQSANVSISDVYTGFTAKSLTVGGREDSTVTIANFVYGTIAPDNNTDVALYTRKGGFVTLQGGGGVITLKGKFKNTEETIPNEPAFMFGAE